MKKFSPNYRRQPEITKIADMDQPTAALATAVHSGYFGQITAFL